MYVADKDYAAKAGMGHFYHICYEGSLTNFEIGEDEKKLRTFIQK